VRKDVSDRAADPDPGRFWIELVTRTEIGERRDSVIAHFEAETDGRQFDVLIRAVDPDVPATVLADDGARRRLDPRCHVGGRSAVALK
jgi:hypothetical protein